MIWGNFVELVCVVGLTCDGDMLTSCIVGNMFLSEFFFVTVCTWGDIFLWEYSFIMYVGKAWMGWCFVMSSYLYIEGNIFLWEFFCECVYMGIFVWCFSLLLHIEILLLHGGNDISSSVQDCSISSANALEIPQSCTKPLYFLWLCLMWIWLIISVLKFVFLDKQVY